MLICVSGVQSTKQMKKFYSTALALLLLASINSQAQTIPNGDFETWQTKNGPAGQYEGLSGNWFMSDELDCNPLTSLKSTDAYSGTYSLKLETGSCQLAGGTHEGLAISAFPCSERPAYLKGWYKSERTNNDTAEIVISLRKWNKQSGSRQTVGEAILKVYNNINTYASFSLPINYINGDLPDSADLMLFSDQAAKRTIGNKLWIDKLSFGSNPVSVYNNQGVQLTKIYPMPASTSINFDYVLKEQSTVCISIMDITGKVVMESVQEKTAGTQHMSFNIQALKGGVYFYNIQTNNERISGRFAKS